MRAAILAAVLAIGASMGVVTIGEPATAQSMGGGNIPDPFRDKFAPSPMKIANEFNRGKSPEGICDDALDSVRKRNPEKIEGRELQAKRLCVDQVNQSIEEMRAYDKAAGTQLIRR